MTKKAKEISKQIQIVFILLQFVGEMFVDKKTNSDFFLVNYKTFVVGKKEITIFTI